MIFAAETDRETLLHRLISDAAEAPHTMLLLADFGWDYAGQAVIVTRKQLSQLLGQYVSGELSSAKLEFWANCVEGRDDIAYEGADQSAIEELIFELANPALTRPLTPERANELLVNLNAEIQRMQR